MGSTSTDTPASALGGEGLIRPPSGGEGERLPDSARAAGGAAAASHAARWALVAVVASRLLVLAAGVLGRWALGPRYHHGEAASSVGALLRFPHRYFVDPWVQWDSYWFLRVARGGYRGIGRAAFFPLYPLLLRAGHLTDLRYGLVGMVVSVACFAAAAAVLFKLVAADAGEDAALWSVVFLSFACTSFFFSAVYSESLFLLLTLAAFAAGRRGHWALAGAAGLLASATRSAGVLLLVPLVWMWVEQRRGRALRLPGARPDPGPAGLSAPRPSPWSLGWLLLVPAGVGLFMAYTRVRFGNALLFMTAERHWDRRLHLPTTAVVRGVQAGLQSARAIAAHPGSYLPFARLPWHAQWITLGNFTAFIALVVAVVLLALCWRLLPSSYTVFAVVSLLLPLAYPTRTTPLLSLPRFVLVDFPLAVGLAVALRRRPLARWLMLGIMTAGLLLLLVPFVNGVWVA
jgi:Mannosyltransferase (PIG-V)